MILSLILNLAESPTSLNQIQKLEEDQPKLLKNEEHFDWASYLNEGNERFILEDQDSGSVRLNKTFNFLDSYQIISNILLII